MKQLSHENFSSLCLAEGAASGGGGGGGATGAAGGDGVSVRRACLKNVALLLYLAVSEACAA